MIAATCGFPAVTSFCIDLVFHGPLLLGLNTPINDLSRGCVADEVYKMAIITASQAL